MSLFDSPRVHFIGVGGAGMSAIAKVLLERGIAVSGSDLKRSRAGTVLEAMGADLNLDGHDASLVREGDVVIVSSAIPEKNPELTRAREIGCEVVSRGAALASLLASSDSIVVAGTHGKTTTTSMITSIMRHAGADPTYLIGGGLNESGTNARFGRGRFAVAESDESDGSFLLLSPFIGVVTNVEADHIDHYGSFEAVRAAFTTFVQRCSPDGSVVVPAGDSELGASARGRVLTFGEDGDARATDVVHLPMGTRFVLALEGESSEVTLNVPGLHNVSNALASAAACHAAGITTSDIAEGLASYRGVERRFQMKGEVAGVTVVDDYAHHPTEIKATLAAARGAVGERGRLVAIFQPHRYSRVSALLDSFGGSFRDADRVVLTDIYGAGESPVPGITGKLVAERICDDVPGRPVAYMPHRGDLLGYMTNMVRHGDLVLTLGAGDITGVGEELLGLLVDR